MKNTTAHGARAGRGRARWRWPRAAAPSTTGSGSGGGTGGGAAPGGRRERGRTTRPTPPAARSGSPTPATGTRSTRPTPTTPTPGTSPGSTAASLMMFKPRPARTAPSSSPDLAEALGKPSADAKTWTYKLRQGVKFEDGTPVTRKDVKYAVERSLDKTTFPNGPTYFNDFLDLQGYTGPYKDTSPDKLGLKAIETPDDQTIVFHLKKPFSGLRLLRPAPSTIPVPQAKDTGTKYKEHVVSTGPYMFETNDLGKSFDAGPQPELGPGHRPEPQGAAGQDRRRAQRQRRRHRQPADRRRPRRRRRGHRRAAGRAGPDPRRPDAQGEHRQRAARPQLVHLRSTADGRAAGQHPLPQGRASTPPTGPATRAPTAARRRRRHRDQPAAAGHPGRRAVRPLPVAPDNTGDLAKAKEELNQCGQPNGFATNISYRAERPKEKATAEALQQSLAKVGIKLTIKPLPAGRLLQALRRQARLREDEQPRPDGQRLGRRLARRLRLPVPDRRQPGHPRRPAATSNLGVRDPGGRRADRQGVDRADDDRARERSGCDVDKKVMEEAVILPGRLGQGPAATGRRT